MTTEAGLPNPGSDEAVAIGCTCPVLDNGRGRGIVLNGERRWWITASCPLHGEPDSTFIGSTTTRAQGGVE